MRGVFLDRSTFSQDLQLPAPQSLSEWQVFAQTPHDDPSLIVQRLQGAAVAVVNKVPLTAEILSALPELRCVQLTATGMNNIDLAAARALGVRVMNVEGYSLYAVPEHTFALMLALMRSLLPYRRMVFDGTWQKSGCFCLLHEPIVDLAGKTLAIIGVGQIGRRVARLAEAFEMRVLLAEHRGRAPRSAAYTPFAEALAQAEVITLHCSLNEETHHLINVETLAMMQARPWLLNLARGDVVDEAAVAQALRRDALRGYAADVLSAEPPTEHHPLLSFAQDGRVILTPHNAWGSHDAQLRMWEIVCRQVNDFVSNLTH